MRKIIADQRIVARDQNKVFVEMANAAPRSPRDVEVRYGLLRGKGAALVEFDVTPDELKSKYNPPMKTWEWYVVGSVDLAGRHAVGRLNV